MEDSEIIRAVREGLSFSQGQLAEALNVAFSTVSAWENGRAKPKPEKWREIAELCASLLAEIAGREKRSRERMAEINALAATLTARKKYEGDKAENEASETSAQGRAFSGRSMKKKRINCNG